MKILKTPLLLTLLLTLYACNSDKRQIVKAAEGYLNATGNYRIEEAAPYATKATRETTLPYMKDYILPATDSASLASNVPATIVLDSMTIVNDTAWVAYTKTTPIKTLNNIIYLIKEDGKWLVDVPLIIPKNLPLWNPNATPDSAAHNPSELAPLEATSKE